MSAARNPIGIFDSGYGGLTVMREIVDTLPGYDYLYLGDNARSPYGPRSFETVYEYTLQCVKYLFVQGCPLVIVACNTASAKALRTIQQVDLPKMKGGRNVLGVIRPTTEVVGSYSKSGHVGVLGTVGTVSSGSYPTEIAKFFPGLKVFQQACPMLVPLIENNEFNNEGADFFMKKYVNALTAQSDLIDVIILGCTHYPLIENKLAALVHPSTRLLSQGPLVAGALKDYLERHNEIASQCTRNGTRRFLTTEQPENFDPNASLFFGAEVRSAHVAL